MNQPSSASLIDRLLADELDAAGFALLEERCRGDAALATELVEQLQQEADLRGCLRRLDLPPGVRQRLQERRVRDGVMQVITERDSARWRRQPMGRRRRPHLRRPGRRRTRRQPGRWPLAVAALLLGGVGLALLWPDRVDPAAQILLIGPTTVAGESVPAGAHPLAWGDTIAGEGATIRHPDGSELQLTGRLLLPAQASTPHWHLAQGRVRCQVAAQESASPFQLATPHGAVTVLGTRFTVTVEQDSSLVAVQEGRVRLSDTAGDRILSADEAGRLGQPADGWRLELVDPDRPAHRRPLRSGDRVSLAAFGAQAINLEVIPPADVESLRFHLDDDEAQLPGGGRRPRKLEQFPPYMVYGNHQHTGRLYRARPPLGTVELRAEAFADDAGEQALGEQRWKLTFAP